VVEIPNTASEIGGKIRKRKWWEKVCAIKLEKSAKKWWENQNWNKISGLGGTFFLPELVGPAVAAELLLVSIL
jgi:hypothetical protein